MSLEKLKEEILSDAEAQVSEILSKAEEEAKKILEDAKSKAEMEKNRRREAVLKRMAEKESAAISLAKIEGKRFILEVKESVLNELYNRVKNELEKLERDQKYLDMLARFTVEAVKELDSNKVYIQLNKGDTELIKKNWQKFVYKVSKELGNVDIELMDEPIDIMGGLVAHSEDGTKIFNSSLDARLERLFKSERNLILTKLFGE